MHKLLQRSLQFQQKIVIIYVSRESHISKRVIRVIKIKENAILAYCYTKRTFRLFKLENILAVDVIRKEKGVS